MANEQVSIALRKLLTILLLILLAGVFFAVYYWVYIPRQHATYDNHAFASLQKIGDNFLSRVKNEAASVADTTKGKNKILREDKPLGKATDKLDAEALHRSFPRIQFKTVNKTDSAAMIMASLKNNRERLAAILSPIVKVYAGSLESVLLIDSGKDILYQDKNLDITYLKTDTAFKKSIVGGPGLADITIRGVDYKMFAVPLLIDNDKNNSYVIAGLISAHDYRVNAQRFPLLLFVVIAVGVMLVLLSIPFLKIFMLSRRENISVVDVRALIAVAFIFPFFLAILFVVAWLNNYAENKNTMLISGVHQQMDKELHNEIDRCLAQMTIYDSLLKKPDSAFAKLKRDTVKTTAQADLRNVLFYPTIYKNIDGIHWMNKYGIDIASFGFFNTTAYFQLPERQYYQYLVKDGGNAKGGKDNKTNFVIEPVLSRLTREYTINIAANSDVNIGTAKADSDRTVLLDLSAKMYSVYKTVVPKGVGYCLVDKNGLIVCHSDTARSLQENLLEETGDNVELRHALEYNDTALLHNVSLYDGTVSMIVKPLHNLPYSLAVYVSKRDKYLYIFHIAAFALVCQSVLIITISLFSYIIFLRRRKLGKLFFTPGVMSWMKPSPDKAFHYVRIMIYFVSVAVLLLITYLILAGVSSEVRTAFLLDGCLLLPLFITCGYYIIRQLYDMPDEGKTSLRYILYRTKYLLVLYLIFGVFFFIFRNMFLVKGSDDCYVWEGWLICFLFLLIPVIAAFISLRIKEHSSQEQRQVNYLKRFLVSFLTGVVLASVVPCVGLLNYAFYHEELLQQKSLQLKAAKNIEQRNAMIDDRVATMNPAFRNSFRQTEQRFIDSMKFHYGVYLSGGKVALHTYVEPGKEKCLSPFYKSVSTMLFLPPDHVEFFNNDAKDYYNWQSEKMLSLYYRPAAPASDERSFVIEEPVKTSRLVRTILSTATGWILFIFLCVGLFLFYKLIMAAAKRIFLIDYFKTVPQYDDWLNQFYTDEEWTILKKDDLLENVKPGAKLFYTVRINEHRMLQAEGVDAGEYILRMHSALESVYDKIWAKCSEMERLTLCDMATDGFTNYKNVDVLLALYKKGIIVYDEQEQTDHLVLMTMSFRNYLIEKESSPEMRSLFKSTATGTWANMRTVFYFVLLGSLVFIFISQEEASRRIIAIVTSLGALVPAMLKLFDKSSGSEKPAEK